MILLREYGVATTVVFPIIKRAVVDFAVSADWTPAAGDVKISKDEGADANTTNLPSAPATTTGKWKLDLTATEMQAKRIFITIIDAATKAVEDQAIIIETFGNASALYTGNLNNLDAATSSRMATFTLPANFSALSISAAGLVDILQSAADKVWSSATRTLTSFGTLVSDIWGNATRTLTALSTALAVSVWDVLESAIITSGSVGLRLDRSVKGIVLATVGVGSSVTSIVTSSLDPAASVIDQYKGRIVIFDKDTTTLALRGQATDITANTAAGVLTVTALTTAPASGDTFVII